MISQNPIFLLVTGDYVIREDTETETIPCSYELNQLISDLIHILHLVSKNQTNFVIDNGVHPSFHPKCHFRLYFQNSI